jgi:small redox-active disulfide protein 2
MNIEVLGTGCSKCKALEQNVKTALSKIEGFHQVKKVDDIAKIISYNVLSTPALVIDGEVVSSGRNLSVEEITKFFEHFC